MRLGILSVLFSLSAALQTQGLQGSGGLLRATRLMCTSHTSVTGTIYSGPEGSPVVALYTKEGCTLCDQAKAILQEVSAKQPHTLKAVDITDADNALWFEKYKYDIPVIHINNMYWAKHRITTERALEALLTAQKGTFIVATGEPDAGRLERKAGKE